MKPSAHSVSRLRRPRASRALLALALAAPLAACGGAPTPPVAPPAAPTALPSAAPSAAPAASAAPGLDPKAVEICLATANVKRAKFSGEPPKVTVKHVLVKHAGAKNPVAGVKRTREEACLRAAEARDKLRGGSVDWADVVKEYSDEPGAASREGLVGAVERKDLAKPFADAAFELGANQLSDVVETESGFHLILRKE
jgi:hypothetical protein